jgi:NADPH:quinone reductase
MRGLVISAEVLEVRDLPAPEPGDGQARLRLQAVPVHPVDLDKRAGYLARLLPERPCYVLGWDAAGTADALGPEVASLAPGDRVCGMSDWLDMPDPRPRASG